MGPFEFVDDRTLLVDGVEFRFGVPPVPGGDAPPLYKSRVLLEQLTELLARVEPRVMVELGIFRGGSAALMALLARPDRLVAVELAEERVAALDDFVAEHGLTDLVVAHYGVDQGDVRRLEEVLDAEIGGRPIDFVIDDASHLYAPSRVSLELLFPRLGPGGVYVIEDWAWEHSLPATLIEQVDRRVDGWQDKVEDLAVAVEAADPELAASLRSNPDRPTVIEACRRASTSRGTQPLSRLGLELLHVRAETADVVRRIVVTQGWIEVERGEEPIEQPGWLDRSAMDLHGSLVR